MPLHLRYLIGAGEDATQQGKGDNAASMKLHVEENRPSLDVKMASQPQRSPPGGAGGGGGRRSFLPAPKRTSGIPTPSSSIPVPSSSSSSIPTPFHSQTPSSTAQLVNRSQKPPAEVSKGSPHREKAPQVQEVIPGAENLVVGERIRISGVKPGILRYVGRTHIAPGFWCGIELYDASGLHDGEVDGQRYFTCKPFRGIFAPVDKVVPDESPPAEEKRAQVTNYADYSGKASKLEYGKISESGKFPSQAGLTRGEAEGGEKGGLKSAPGDSGYRISAFSIRRHGGQDTSEAGYYKSRMSSSTHGDSQDPNRATAADEAEVCSRHVKEHLQSDSRRYFNLTFGRDTPPLPHPHSNLPDLLSSVSPPSPQEEAAGGGGGPSHRQSSHTQGACDVSDIHLDFQEGGQERGLMEGVAAGRHSIPATSESDASLSGHSSSLEEASVATVMEVVRGEPKPASRAGEDAKAVEASRRSGSRSSVGQDSVEKPADDRRKAGRHKPRTSSTSGRAEEEEGSNEVSPEVSQVLEWDYDHDAFDGSGTVAEVGRDLNREDAARLDNRQSTDKPVLEDESEESEEEEDDEEEEETSEEETTSEEEESEEEEDDDDEEEEETEEEETEEESEEEESEDDRIEADRNGPQARTSVASTGGHDGRVAPPAAAASNQNQAMNGSMVVGSEMTESTDTVSLKQAGTTADGMPSEPSSSQKPDPANTTKAASKTRKGSGSGSSKQKPKKKRSSPNSAEDKKIVAQHKKAIKSASSRLADYIKAPLPPPKPKEEKKSKKKAENKEKKSSKKSKKDRKTSDKSKEETKEEEEKKKERKQPRVREEKPKVKRTVVKSKWGNIMSQIEASKNTVKIKPKEKIQSSLAVYLSTPAPPNPKKEAAENTEPKEVPKPKPKPKLIKHPKPDFSNIKSKLNITPPPPLPRRDSNSGNLKSPNLKSPNILKGSTNKNSAFSTLKDPGVKPGEARTRTNVSRKPPVPKFNAKDPADKKQEGLEKETAHSQRSGSCNSLAATDGNTVSRAGARLRSERASSATSTKSDTSNAQRSVKSMNQRNVQKTEQQTSGEQQDKRSTAKSSSSPPAVPKKADQKKSGEGERGPGTRSSASPPKATAPSRPAWGACAGRSSADQNRNARTKAGPGLLKSGHPPDVVSTSARGSRAQEVARLESLCEARTKELNYTRMQLKAGLQAFDAMACLLNYCSTELDAFSCPAISAKLKTATDTLSEQQHSLDLLNEEKQKTDQQLREVTEARDAAQQEVEKLKQEMQQAEEAHSAAQQKLQEEQSAALKALKEEISSQHQETMQQMQKYQENQSEYTRQSHKRQLVELTSEHQMATNQLKVAHLEDIQALRNKHELQVEELHVQHRKKLEDITERFESIKLSLTEKVQSLCGECDDLRLRAKSSEEALQRDADVKVQLALTPYLHLPKEIESLKTVIDMRTEEIQKLRRQNMDLVKQLEELPIVQEKVVSLQQKVENLQAIINIKTDHEKQLHEKCQVLMRKYDRESKANKRLSMDYEQVVWRMSQSADFTGSLESISPRQLSRSPSRGGEHHHSHGSSPVRSLSTSSQGAESVNGVVQRQRKASGGDDDSDPRRRANTFSDTPRHRRIKGDGGDLNGPGSGSSGKRRVLSKSGDYSEMVSASSKEHEESFSSGHESGDTSDFFSSLESNVILETAQGVSFQLLDKTASSAAVVGEGGGGGAPVPAPSQDDVFVEEGVVLHAIQDVSPEETSSPDTEGRQTDVTVVVTCPSSSQ